MSQPVQSSMDPVSGEDLLPVDLLRIALGMNLRHEKRQTGMGRMDQQGMKENSNHWSPGLTP